MRLVRVLLFASIAFAQEPIRVELRLVEANVIARDRSGPVGDLKEGDFKLVDNGKEQKIAIFRVAKATAPNARPPVPGVYSNRGKTAPGASATVLLIDTLNTQPPDQLYAQKQIIEMLGSFRVKDPMALYVLGEKLTVLQDFTTDRNALLKAIQAWKPEGSQILEGSTTPTPPKAGRGGAEAGAARGFADVRNFYLEARARQTVDAFELIAQRLLGVPGRKNVVWVSSGFPSNFLKLHADKLRTLNQADIAIYPVNARGLTTGRVPSSADVLTEIADETGGVAFNNTNDLSGAIGKAMEDAQFTYTLGFYAQSDKPDGVYHELRVKVDRPGIDLRYRKGYLDVAASASADQDALVTLRRSASAPVDARAIGLAAAAVRDTDGKFQVGVMVDFRDLQLGKIDGHWKGAAELAIVSQRADGTTVDLASKSLTFDMTDEIYAKHQREGFSFEQDLPAGKDVSRIRVVVVDRANGAVGSVSAKPR
jgi:VWFA-related protein